MAFHILVIFLLTFSFNTLAKDELVVEFKAAPAQKQVSGFRYYIDKKDLKNSLSPYIAQGLQKSIKARLEKQGYKLAKSMRKAHLIVQVASGKRTQRRSIESLITGNNDLDKAIQDIGKKAGRLKGVTTSKTTTYINGKLETKVTKTFEGKRPYFGLSAYIYSYGKRPEYLSHLNIWSPESEWTGYENKLTAKVTDRLKVLFPKAPKKNMAMKGDPACVPAFGYDRNENTVTEVIKGSSAEKAGFKVGDVILAIDSNPGSYNVSREVYEKSIEVPVKLKRGEKIIRTQVKSKIVCL